MKIGTHNVTILIVVLVIIAGFLVILALLPGKTPLPPFLSQGQPTPTPIAVPLQTTTGQSVQVVSFSPNKLTVLVPNSQQSFSITFSRAIIVDDFFILLKKTPFTSTNVTSVPITITLSSDKKNLFITPGETISPSEKYELLITSKVTKNVLFDIPYLSNNLPTPVKQNDTTLSQYLPYQTPHYKLSYLTSQNVYVFNFIYDPSSSDDIQTQYTNAKNEAQSFIQSKGINSNDITIEWRHS